MDVQNNDNELFEPKQFRIFQTTSQLLDMKYEAIIVSDLHLGTKDSKTEEFLNFIEKHPTDLLILNGDIVDGWALNRHVGGATVTLRVLNLYSCFWARSTPIGRVLSRCLGTEVPQ